MYTSVAGSRQVRVEVSPARCVPSPCWAHGHRPFNSLIDNSPAACSRPQERLGSSLKRTFAKRISGTCRAAFDEKTVANNVSGKFRVIVAGGGIGGLVFSVAALAKVRNISCPRRRTTVSLRAFEGGKGDTISRIYLHFAVTLVSREIESLVRVPRPPHSDACWTPCVLWSQCTPCMKGMRGSALVNGTVTLFNLGIAVAPRLSGATTASMG